MYGQRNLNVLSLSWFFFQPFKKVKAILFHGQWQGGRQPDVGSNLPTPSLIQIKKKAMEAQGELILTIFLLKNVDFEFPTCYRPFGPISHPGMLASNKLTSKNAQVPERGLKPIKCFSLHNENQGNGENKPPRVCFLKNSRPFALCTNNMCLSLIQENIRRFVNIS